MAEDLQTGICSGGSWWNPEGSGSFDAPTSMSCSTAMADMIGGRTFCWSAGSGDDSAGSASGSSIAFQDFRYGGRPEGSLHAMLQEDLGSRPYIRQDPPDVSNKARTGAESSTANPSSDMNQNLLVEQHHFSSGHESSDAGVGSYQIMYGNRLMNGYQSPTTSYQGSSNELWQPSWAKFSHQFLKSSHPKQQSNNQLQFTNNTPFWNASAAASVVEVRSALCSPATLQFDLQPRTIYRNLTAKTYPEGIHDSCSSSTMKPGSQPAATKKLRIETPSPLPTFKVSKEKLGDRITALQQIVSPFGKTDTASVLQEAIEYIKFLHDQVGVLSSPYLKMSDKSKDCSEPNEDLRSRGLCLVPIASTHPVASETTADFWHPTFGGTFR